MTIENILKYYYEAKERVYRDGYYSEIYWQEKQDPAKISTKKYYSEYSWVVLSSGMRETVIRNKFIRLTQIFGNWNPRFVTDSREIVQQCALQEFNNLPKIRALILMADYLNLNPIQLEIENISTLGYSYLQKFPFLGPATSLHFAKNLGFTTSKPDRHLIRISSMFGYECPVNFCKIISEITGEKESVIDIVLWRFATLEKNYLAVKNG
jgi:hypothetical protein